MDYLWTPWRYQYVSGLDKGPGECVFCRLPHEQDEEALIVFRGRWNYIVLNRYPYTSGHAMVVPFRHFSSFREMSEEEAAEKMRLAQRLQEALQNAYRPEGFNIGWNQGKCAGAGVAGHIHLHLVPRWNGDTNLVSVLGETRTLPEDLSTTRQKLLPFFSP